MRINYNTIYQALPTSETLYEYLKYFAPFIPNNVFHKTKVFMLTLQRKTHSNYGVPHSKGTIQSNPLLLADVHRAVYQLLGQSQLHLLPPALL